MDPQDVNALIPRTCEYVILHGERNFVDVTKLRILRWEANFGLPRLTNVIIGVLIRRRQEGQN